jgi:hypothetical protein
LDASMMMIKAKPDDAKLFTNSWNKSTVSICLSSGLCTGITHTSDVNPSVQNKDDLLW